MFDKLAQLHSLYLFGRRPCKCFQLHRIRISLLFRNWQRTRSVRLTAAVMVFLLPLVMSIAACGEATPSTATAEPSAAAEEDLALETSTAAESTREPTNSEPVSSATPTEPEVTPTPAFQVIHSSVSVRDGPGTTYAVIEYLYEDDIITPVSTNDDSSWFKIVLEDGTEGWVAASVVAPLQGVTTFPEDGSGATAEPGKYGLLTITGITVENGAVLVNGSTDLPDGAVLDVTFDIAEYGSPDDPYVGVSTEAEVQDGNFSATIEPPDIEQYQTGPYEVEVNFRTQGLTGPIQSESVIAAVGEDGEFLVGDKVRELRTGAKSLYESQIVDLSLDIQSPGYPQLKLSAYAVGSPERALVEYLLAWQSQDWERMAQFTQKTWKDGLSNPAEELMYMYDFKSLLGAELGEKEVVSEGTMVSIDARIFYSVRPTEVTQVIIRPMIVRETVHYQPSESGDWGVNPISTLDEEEVE